MGLVYAEITLKNAGDFENVVRGYIKENAVRQTTVTALVDTGAGTLVITEEIRKKLGLRIEGFRRSTLADGGKAHYQLTEPVRVSWKDRFSTCAALVLPDAEDVLLGAIPLEDMDLMIHPATNQLTGAHGDEILCTIK
jgi:clan AA aspartic protease